MHPKLKLKFEFIKFKVICILLGKSYTFASNKAIILTSILLLGMISVICLLLGMYKIVNKKGENKKCNKWVAWSVQQLRKREEIKWGIRVFEVAFQFTK